MIARIISVTNDSILYTNQISMTMSTTAVVEVTAVDDGPRNRATYFQLRMAVLKGKSL